MMRSLGYSRRLLCRGISHGASPIAPAFLNLARHRRAFHGSSSFWGIRSQVLKDVGEGKLNLSCLNENWLTCLCSRDNGSPDHTVVCGRGRACGGMETTLPVPV